jgi:membrane fusion protein, multidrug efflux system
MNDFILKGFLALFIVFSFSSCKSTPVKEKEVKAKEVEAGLVQKKDAPIYVRNFGMMRALNSADIVAQATGVITEYHFEEGSFVYEGDLLFTIDPKPYKVAYNQSLAQLAKDEANMGYSKDKVERYKELATDDFVSKLDYDQYVSEYEAAKATVLAQASAVEAAAINLNYCYVKAPFNGRTGERLIDKGNLATANSTQLVNIKQISPLFVEFTLPEKYLSKALENQRKEPLLLNISFPNGKETYSGELVLIDNEVNVNTGSFKLRGKLPNDELKLWPGQYVNVELLLEVKKNVVLCPSSAIQLGAKGRYAIVINNNGEAEFRDLTVGDALEKDTIILKGLKEGEKVVTQNVVFVRPGSKVVIKESSKSKKND